MLEKINQVEPNISEQDIQRVNDYMSSGAWITEHVLTKELEEKIANFVGVKFPPLEGSNLPQVDDRPFILRGPIGENITYNIDGVKGPDLLNKDQMYNMHFKKFPIGKGGNAKKALNKYPEPSTRISGDFFVSDFNLLFKLLFKLAIKINPVIF